ncbi:hypothetical protein GCM10010466_64930 [Planomonospora alba]|uniref:Uncharacterized protein n=1 Tax=Planomonospora alba TaxID=161354 RepID=A0ABP6P1Z4_9ACTN
MRVLKRVAISALAAGATVAMAISGTPASADSVTPSSPEISPEVSIMAAPSGCSMWTDWGGGRGRGHLSCAGKKRDVRVTVKCGDGSVKRSAVGYEYAKAECPTGLGATAVSGGYA